MKAAAAAAVCVSVLAMTATARAEVGATTTAGASISDIGQLSIEELANVEIISTTKRGEPLSRAPASVFVITREDIRRSGATSLPEVLRLAPNLQVAQHTAADYVISARGFNGVNTNNKLLVLIDGRSVYSPLHSQVFWDSQPVLLGDIERIEVVSGPGGTLWGANAVNGVINIITRNSVDTQGGLAVGTGGDQERDVSLRYGGQIGESTTYRAYIQGFDRDGTLRPPGAPDDAWRGLQGGFRLDTQAAGGLVTVQGDAYRNHAGIDYTYLTGYNLVGRWSRDFQNGSSLTAQAYFDRAYRWAYFADDRVNTYDAQVQYNLAPGARHQIVIGGGYRFMQDRFRTIGLFYLDPAERDVSLGNVFVQDDISLRKDLKLTLGFKVEDSSFTGVEYMPNVRLAWDTGRTGLLWGAVSRSVRTPSTLDRDITAVVILQRAEDFASESVVAFEAGYRVQPTARTSLSVSTFYNLYDHVRTLGLANDPAFLFKLSNDLEGETYGLEAWGDYTPTDWWRLSAGINLLEKDLHVKDGLVDYSGLTYAGNDPSAQAFVRSQMNIRPNVEFDLAMRAVDRLSLTMTPGYVEADARLAWRIRNDLEVSVVGRNLLDAAHPEITLAPSPASEIRRSIYFTVRAGF